MRAESHEEVKRICEQILISKWPHEKLQMLPRKENREMKSEIRIGESITLRMYNKNPAVFIN
jgi:hypothetical protein